MNPLLNQPLMLRIIRIHHLNRLPASLPLRGIIRLERKRAQQRRQRQSLRIHTRLHQLLGSTHIRGPVHEDPGPGHADDPETGQDRVSVLAGPGFGALEGGFVGG